MKNYIGTKEIKAETCTFFKYYIEKYGETKFNERKDDLTDNDGYRVEYEDGYTSWSPCEAFEKAYHEINGTENLLILPIKQKLNTLIMCDDAAANGASRNYWVKNDAKKILGYVHFMGSDNPIADGVTMEDLLMIVMDRLSDFQSTDKNCRENEKAIQHIEEALFWLNHRQNDINLRKTLGLKNKCMCNESACDSLFFGWKSNLAAVEALQAEMSERNTNDVDPVKTIPDECRKGFGTDLNGCGIRAHYNSCARCVRML